MRRSSAATSNASRSTGATRTTSVPTSSPPVRPRRRPNVAGSAQQDRDAAGRRSESEVERVGEARSRLGTGEPGDVLPQHQRGFQQDQRVDDDDAGGHQHDPPPRQRVQRTGEERGDGEPDDEHDRAEHDLVVGEQQRPGRDARGDGEHGERNGSEQQRRRDAQRETASRRRTRARSRRLARPVPTSANAAATIVDATASVALSADVDGIATTDTTYGARRDDAEQGESPRSRREQRDADPRPTRTTTTRVATTAGACDQSASASASASPAANGKQRPAEPRTPQEDVRHLLSGSSRGRPYTTNFMPTTVLAAGMATGVGSLPHRDADAAAALVLRCLPELPAAPQLPQRSAREGMLAQWMHGVVGVDVADDGAIRDQRRPRPAGVGGSRTARRRARRRRRVRRRDRRAASRPEARQGAGDRAVDARPRAHRCRRRAVARVRARDAGGSRVGRRTRALLRRPPARAARSCCSSTSPRWCSGAARHRRSIPSSPPMSSPPPWPRRAALTGVHVCGAGELAIALAAGPNVVHVDVENVDFDDAIALSRFLDGGGWVVWGAVPTHGPIGEHPVAAVEGAARRVVRADAPRLRPGPAAPAGARRARVRAWPVTVRARPSGRCCSHASSATGCTTRPRRRSSRSAPN